MEEGKGILSSIFALNEHNEISSCQFLGQFPGREDVVGGVDRMMQPPVFTLGAVFACFALANHVVTATCNLRDRPRAND